MARAKWLSDMEIDEISLVDRPANRHARVAISKRADEEAVMPEYFLQDGSPVATEVLRRLPRTLELIAAAAVLAEFGNSINPVTGGLDGTGWAFGRPVLAGEVYAVLQAVRGVELVDDLKLWEADPVTGKRGGEPTMRIDLDPNALVYSYRHSVRAVSGV